MEDVKIEALATDRNRWQITDSFEGHEKACLFCSQLFEEKARSWINTSIPLSEERRIAKKSGIIGDALEIDGLSMDRKWIFEIKVTATLERVKEAVTQLNRRLRIFVEEQNPPCGVVILIDTSRSIANPSKEISSMDRSLKDELLASTLGDISIVPVSPYFLWQNYAPKGSDEILDSVIAKARQYRYRNLLGLREPRWSKTRRLPTCPF